MGSVEICIIKWYDNFKETEHKFRRTEVLHMGEEEYKKLIIEIVSTSRDVEYLIAVYTFAKHYPDKSKEKE